MKRNIIIICLLLLSCSLLEYKRDPDNLREWVDMKVGNSYRLEIQKYLYDLEETDKLIDSAWGFIDMTIDSYDCYYDLFQEYEIEMFYTTETWTIYDTSGEYNKFDYNYEYRLIEEYCYKSSDSYSDRILKTPINIGEYWHSDQGVKFNIMETYAKRTINDRVFNGLVIMKCTFLGDTIAETWYSPEFGIYIYLESYCNEYFNVITNKKLINSNI